MSDIGAKAIVRTFLEAFSAPDYGAAFSMADPGGFWKIWSGAAEPEVVRIGEMRARLEAAAAMMAEPVAWQAQSLTEEDGHVFAEIVGSGETSDGFEYRNNYAVLFRVENDHIVLIEEMFEDKPVKDLLNALQAA